MPFSSMNDTVAPRGTPRAASDAANARQVRASVA
jgi:hypothetical protein